MALGANAGGATLGVLGGGQLGRMMAHEARRMGYRVVVLMDGGEPQMVFGQFGGNEGSVRGTPTSYSEMLAQIQSKNIKEATIEGEKIIALTKSGTVLTANTTALDRGLIDAVQFKVVPLFCGPGGK